MVSFLCWRRLWRIRFGLVLLIRLLCRASRENGLVELLMLRMVMMRRMSLGIMEPLSWLMFGR